MEADVEVPVFFVVFFFFYRRLRSLHICLPPPAAPARELLLPVSHLADILAPLIATFAGGAGVQVGPRKQMVFNFKYY